MKNKQAHRKALVLLTAGLALAAQSQAASLPTVYRATATVYASASGPQGIAFAADGTMYVGRDIAGSTGVDALKIYRIGTNGTPVDEFGRTAITDPDAVVVDHDGVISGIPGAVLVGGLDGPGSANGHIKAISPSGLVFELFTGLASFRNINAFTRDRTGRLLTVDAETGNWGEVTASSVTALGQVPPEGIDIAVDASNRVWVSSSADTRIRVFSATGAFLFHASVGAKAASYLAYSSSQFWGTNIYAIGTNGNLLSIDLAGNVQIRGSGFQDTPRMAFGDDGSLYLSEFYNNRIIKISPDGGPTVNVQISCVDVCWNSLSNLTYQVQYRSDLTTNQWVNLGSPVPGTGTDMCITDTIKDQPKKFYRVVETP